MNESAESRLSLNLQDVRVTIRERVIGESRLAIEISFVTCKPPLGVTNESSRGIQQQASPSGLATQQPFREILNSLPNLLLRRQASIETFDPDLRTPPLDSIVNTSARRA